MFIYNLIRGMFMAFADSVPGVSGGTIAFVMGFYNEFISSISVLTSRSSKEDKKSALLFLAKIGIGWVIGMVISILLISSILDEHIYKISSLFLGFIVFSIPLIYKEEKSLIRSNTKHFTFLIIGALIVGLITYFNPVSNSAMTTLNTQTSSTITTNNQDTEASSTLASTNTDVETNSSLDSEEETTVSEFSFTMGIYVFFAGMIAISAMILPGISGSTLLLIFGLYSTIIGTLKNFIKYALELLQYIISQISGNEAGYILPTFDMNGFLLLVFFGFGVLTGIVTVVRIISRLLETHRSQMIYLIFGLMIGSLYAVIMGPTTLDIPQSPMSLSTFSLLFFVLGAAVIIGIEKLKTLMQSKDIH